MGIMISSLEISILNFIKEKGCARTMDLLKKIPSLSLVMVIEDLIKKNIIKAFYNENSEEILQVI